MENIEPGSEVKVSFPFDKVELMDYQEQGALDGSVKDIFYKGNHYHVVVRLDSGERLYVDTQDIWDKGDLVGVNIASKDITVSLK